MDYQLDQLYTINLTYPGPREAYFVGYIKGSQYMGGSPLKARFPVFKLDFYSHGDPTCLMAFEDDDAVEQAGYFAHGRNPQELMESFRKCFAYFGTEYAMIQVGINEDTSSLSIPRDQFIAEARAAGVNQSQIDIALERGYYQTIHSPNGEIKRCPTCKVIRQTTCCACGCGSCTSCGHRWCCIPAMPPIAQSSIVSLGGFFPFAFTTLSPQSDSAIQVLS